jgi:hypothetical protein
MHSVSMNHADVELQEVEETEDFYFADMMERNADIIEERREIFLKWSSAGNRFRGYTGDSHTQKRGVDFYELDQH